MSNANPLKFPTVGNLPQPAKCPTVEHLTPLQERLLEKKQDAAAKRKANKEVAWEYKFGDWRRCLPLNREFTARLYHDGSSHHTAFGTGEIRLHVSAAHGSGFSIALTPAEMRKLGHLLVNASLHHARMKKVAQLEKMYGSDA